MNDKDVSTSREEPYQWRSKEVERQRGLEVSGVIEATRHPRHGQAASLKKTLAVCVVALAAVGAMVAGGLLTQDAKPLPERPAVVADAAVAALAADEESSQVATAEQPGLDFEELAVVGDPEAEVPEPNRANCEAIYATAYESESERIWFLANCVEPEPVVAFLAAPELSGAVSQPVATTLSGPAEVSAGLSAGDVIASSIDWITNQQDAAYDVRSESCSASEVGELWLVSCERSLTGCADEICTSWISVCVTDADGAVLSNNNC